MSKTIILLESARAEFDEAANWYDRQSKGLGSRFTAAVDVVLQRISDRPEIHAVVIDDVRQVIVQKFPFSIVYRVLPETILVVAIFHASRDPSIWRNRL